MNILYVGDIMGPLGIRVVTELLPSIKKEHKVDVVIAQGENVSGGKGINAEDYKQLKILGVDFFTGGNWSTHKEDIIPTLNDPNQPIIRPANYPLGTPGLGYKYLNSTKGKILVISLLGQIVGRDAELKLDNPLKVVDQIIKSEEKTKKLTTIVNFHGDFSSQKIVIGYYLDGRVGAVIGDHWHVPTADAMVLPKGTAHITDVGMCGSLDSSLGVKLGVIINRWLSDTPSRNVLEDEGRTQFNAVLVEVEEKTGLAQSIQQIQIIR